MTLKCKRCGNEQDGSVRCCHVCGAFMEGPAVNNVTGEFGYRGSDGMFYKSEEDYIKAGSHADNGEELHNSAQLEDKLFGYIEDYRLMKKYDRRREWLERAMLAVVVCVALSVVSWIFCGRYIQALNNVLWLFVAFMYWRQMKYGLHHGRFTIGLMQALFAAGLEIAALKNRLKKYEPETNEEDVE